MSLQSELRKLRKKAGHELNNLGIPTSTRGLARRIAGKRNLPVLGFPAHKAPVPARGLPGVMAGPGQCIAADPRDGSIRRPYALIGVVSLAASSFAIETSGGDFLAAASVDDITTDNVIPFGVTVTQAQLFISTAEIIASPTLLAAALAGVELRYFVNGIEEARWPVAKFNPLITAQGFTSSGAAGYAFQLAYDPVPFHVEFDPDKTYKLQLFTTKAVTPAAVSIWTLVLDGMR